MKNAFLGGALILTEMDGKEFPGPINADIIKKYYAWGNKGKRLVRVGNPKERFWQEKKKEKKGLRWKPEKAV